MALEKVVDEEPHFQKDGFNGLVVVAPMVAAEFEPSSVCLDSMVQSFIEENNNNNNNEKQSGAVRRGRNHCNYFNRNYIDSSSEDEWDSFGDSNYSSTAVVSTPPPIFNLPFCPFPQSLSNGSSN